MATLPQLTCLEIDIDAMKARPVDLSSLAQTTSVRFASVELVEMAAHNLEKIAAEMKQDDASQQVSAGIVGASTKDQASSDQPAVSDAAAPTSESTSEVMPVQQPEAVASKEKTNTSDRNEPAREQPKEWVDRVVNAGHSILWPPPWQLVLLFYWREVG